MVAVVMTDLQQQLEAVRQEAFAAGYASAMKKVTELTARAIPDVRDAAEPSHNGRGRGRGRAGARKAAPTSPPVRRRRANALTAGRTAKAGRSTVRLPRRGTNAVLIAEVLKSAAPRPLRQAEIRRVLQDSGTSMSFPSIGYSLRQLEAGNAAQQVGKSKTWRYRKA